jgi:hypothetical protein
MSNQETPVKDEETPLSEEHGENVTTQEQAANAVHSRGDPLWSPSTPPYNPPPQPPYTWPQYYPASPRRRSSWLWIILAIVLLFMLLGGGIFSLFSIFGNSIVGFGNTAVETRNFTVSASPTLVLNNDTGSIHVRVANSVNQVTIQATKHSNFGSNLNDVNVSYTQNTGGNTINVNVDRTNGFNLFTSTSVEFDITVPSTAVLQLKTNTGSIDVTGVSGQMVLTSNTGSITAIGGTVSGNTGLITNTGSITFNGSIDQTGNYQFVTNTGSVNVTLPGGSAFHVNASTDTGSINTNFPGVTVQHQGMGANASGDVGSSPQATVSLRTNTGSINLYQR